MIGAIYVYSAIWSLMPAFGIGAYDVEPFGLSCTLDWKNRSQSKCFLTSVSLKDLSKLERCYCYISSSVRLCHEIISQQQEL